MEAQIISDDSLAAHFADRGANLNTVEGCNTLAKMSMEKMHALITEWIMAGDECSNC
jgi:hypothetical protein